MGISDSARSSCSSFSDWLPRPGRRMCSTRPSVCKSSIAARASPTARVAIAHGFPWAFALWVGVPIGLLATALLQANNLRDVETDTETRKKTVAVRLGRVRAGYLYVGTLVAAAASIGVLQHYRGWSLIALAAIPLAIPPARLALSERNGRELLPMLASTAALQLVVGILLTIGLLLVRA